MAAQRGPLRVVGRYALYDEIAAGGMATVHIGRLLGPGRLRAHRRDQAPASAVREGPRVRLDVPRRGAARGARPAPERRRDARRRRDRRRALPRHGLRARRVALDADPRGPKARRGSRRRASRPRSSCGVLHGLHAAHEAKNERGERSIDRPPRRLPAERPRRRDGVARVLDFGVAKAAGRIQRRATADQRQARVHVARAALRAARSRAPSTSTRRRSSVGGAHGRAPLQGRQRRP